MPPTTASIDVADDEPSQHPNASGKRPIGSGTREGTRRAGEHLHRVRRALLQWRANTRKRDYPHSCFTGIALLPDGPLTTIASNRRLKVLDDLRTVLSTSWAFVDTYGEEVLALVKKVDEEDKDIRAMKTLAKRQATDAAKAAQSRTTDTKPTHVGARARGRPPKGKENARQIPGMSCFHISELSIPSPAAPTAPAYLPSTGQFINFAIPVSASASLPPAGQFINFSF
ncbi:hypothetical protein EV363DRAFT_1336905 [Boletus edulis]|nr:hypothetical protein EV363DRAFT_1336905 [Boletus edulis]